MRRTILFLHIFVVALSHSQVILNGTMKNIHLNLEKTGESIISNQCESELSNLDPETLYKMIDSSASIPNGLLSLNFFHLGNFQECFSIATNSTRGKYCLGTIPLKLMANRGLQQLLDDKLYRTRIDLSEPRILGKDVELYAVHMGFCLPNSCKLGDFTNLTSDLVKFDENLCYSQDTQPKFDMPAIITIMALAVFLLLVILATIFDVYFNETKKLPKVLIAFSVYTNGKQLLSTTGSSPDQILCLNGIKALSTMWVILCHVYANSIMGPVQDFDDVIKWKENTLNWIVAGSSVSVDSFFTISGIVVVYTFLRAMDKSAKFNVFSFYLHRYIRLTPALAVVILIHITLIKYLGNGPLWHSIQDDLINSCKEYWWSGLLYVQNIFHGDGTCVPQSWYLSVDFQLFFLSPLVLLPLKWKPKLAFFLIGALTVLGFVVPFVITYKYELGNYTFQTKNHDDMMWLYYKQTHTRFGPYIIGLLAGYFIYNYKKTKTKIELKPVTAITSWSITIIGLFGCLFWSHQDSPVYNQWLAACINGFRRNIWSLCLCAFIGLCITGYGKALDRFLSLDVFQILNKLAYSMYLTHYAPITMRYAASKIPYPFSNQYLMMMFWGDFMLTLVLSLVLYLTFESPMITLEKIIFRRRAANNNIYPNRKPPNRHI